MNHYVVCQFMPPGRLLQLKPEFSKDDIFVFKDIKLQNSKWNSIKYIDEMVAFGLEENETAGAIFEIKAYDSRKTKPPFEV